MRARLALGVLGLVALTPACSATVGSPVSCEAAAPIPAGTIDVHPRCPEACDPFAARAIVHDRNGLPFFAGQALVLGTCSGGGAFCHVSNAADRIGAPATLDFGLIPITDPARYDAEIDVRADVHAMVLAQRNAMWGQIVSGAMPPGVEGEANIVREYGYVTDPLDPDTDVLLADLDTPEGQEIVRNWLACGAPFIERTFPVPAPTCSLDSDCPSDTCIEGTCAPLGEEAPAILRFVPCEDDTDCPSGSCSRMRCVL